jgi:hypothetical protein
MIDINEHWEKIFHFLDRKGFQFPTNLIKAKYFLKRLSKKYRAIYQELLREVSRQEFQIVITDKFITRKVAG